MIRNLALALLLATPAVANADEQPTPPRCRPLDDMTAWLAHEYGETQYGIGLSLAGHLTMLFASEGGATWTIVVVSPDKQACIADGGRELQLLKRPEPGQGT